jgi:hypothetical protein
MPLYRFLWQVQLAQECFEAGSERKGANSGSLTPMKTGFPAQAIRVGTDAYSKRDQELLPTIVMTRKYV